MCKQHWSSQAQRKKRKTWFKYNERKNKIQKIKTKTKKVWSKKLNNANDGSTIKKKP